MENVDQARRLEITRDCRLAAFAGAAEEVQDDSALDDRSNPLTVTPKGELPP